MKIKNWKEFQHYKDRDPKWIKLYTKLLNDDEWFSLDTKHAKVLVMLWLLASEDPLLDGNLPSVKKMAFRLRMSESSLESTLSSLSHWVEQPTSELLANGYQPAISETETYKEETEEIPRSTPRLAGKVGFPQDWKPSQEEMDQWKSHGILNPWIEFATFRDHALSNDRRCKDWPAAWRNWCRKAIKMKEDRANGVHAMRV